MLRTHSLSDVRPQQGVITERRHSEPPGRLEIGRSRNNAQVTSGHKREKVDVSPKTSQPESSTRSRKSETLPDSSKSKGVVSTIITGLKRLVDPKYTQSQDYNLDRQVGKRFGDDDAGMQLGHYIIVSDKRKGVEPGFVATKAWTEKDTHNMVENDKHKFSIKANAFLEGELTKQAKAGSGPLLDKLNDFLDKRAQLLGEDKPDIQEFLTDPAHSAAKAVFLKDLKRDRAVQDLCKQEVMTTEPKFAKRHYVKLDYLESDRTLTGNYRIPRDKAKGFMHWFFKSQSRSDINKGAVRECLANDLMSKLGVHSQKLKIIPAQWNDGYPKLLLDSTHVKGPKGGDFSDFDGCIRDGQLVEIDTEKTKDLQSQAKKRLETHPNDKSAKKQAKETVPKQHQDGTYKLDRSMEELGRNKIFMLLMSDRDALGSTGGNKGRGDNRFVGIDPGHALEERLLGRTDDIRSDFSFKQPWGTKFGLGYKNFTIFDQQPLSEKMEGVRKLKELAKTGEDVAVFDDYAKQFDGSLHKDLNYKREFEGLRDMYVDRRTAILNVFKERLEVDGFNFQDGIKDKENDPRQKELANKALDVLDNLEKLTSETRSTSPKGQVALDRPLVTKRKEWHIEQDKTSNNIVMSFEGGSRSRRSAETAIRDMIKKDPALGKAFQEGAFELRNEGGRLKVIVPHDGKGAANLEKLAAALTNDAVMRHKHPDSPYSKGLTEQPRRESVSESESSLEEPESRRSSVSFIERSRSGPPPLTGLPERAIQPDAQRLMEFARSRLSHEPLGEGTTPRPIANGRDFYLEEQENASCARHAINAFLGGPIANDESFTAVNMATRAERLLRPQEVRRSEVDSRQGNYPSQVQDFMDLLHDEGLGPKVVLHNIDLSGTAIGMPHDLPEITGDRAIVGTMTPSEHYVAFRKDTAGEWWKLDSLSGEGPVKMSPQEFVGGLPKNQQIGVIVPEG